MNRMYEEEYHKEKHNYLYNNEEYYLVRARIAKHDYFKYLSSEAKVLEFGCGLGQNIYLLPNRAGYDISKFAVDFCKKKGIKATTNLKSIKDNYHDIILCSEVLEHLENPLEALRQMRKKLRFIGTLVLVIPIDKWNKPNVNDVNKHFYNWNFNTITNLLVKAGFSTVEYEIIRRTGFKILLPFSRISFGLYLFLTKLAAILSDSKHIKIVAMKN